MKAIGLILVAVAGCASSGSSASPTTAVTPASAPAGSMRELETSDLPAFNVSMTVMRNEPADTIAMPAQAAWRALAAAYTSVGLKLLGSDSTSQSIASTMMRVHQFLGRTPLSRYMTCGRTAFGDASDTQEITLRVRSTVEPGASGEAIVRTLVRAVATPQGSNAFQCSSTRASSCALPAT
ncbi:MAG: hypothetical protein ACJ796_14740 [Gemmatimonadaceae bacterium]